MGPAPRSSEVTRRERPGPPGGAAVPGQVRTWAPGPRQEVGLGRSTEWGRVREGSGRRRHGTGLGADEGPEEGRAKRDPRAWIWSGVAWGGAAHSGRSRPPSRPVLPGALPTALPSDPTCRRNRGAVIAAARDPRVRLVLALCPWQPGRSLPVSTRGAGPGGNPQVTNIQVTFPGRSPSSAGMGARSRHSPGGRNTSAWRRPGGHCSPTPSPGESSLPLPFSVCLVRQTQG